jgi:type IV pilus assembly protein PilN
MRVRLNVASNPLQSHRRFLAGSGLLGAVGLIVFAGLGWHVYGARKANAEMRAKTARIDDQVEQVQRQREELKAFFAEPENARLHDRAAFINNLIDARSFNWTLMFMDLEKILPPGVRIVSIEPKQDNGKVEVKFTIGAASDDANLKFIKALEDSKSFSHVELIAVHTPSATQVGGDPIVAELTAEYSRS